MGPIPKGWRAGLLRDTCESIDYGYTASAVDEPIGPKFLRITDIVPDTIDWASVSNCLALIGQNMKRSGFCSLNGARKMFDAYNRSGASPFCCWRWRLVF